MTCYKRGKGSLNFSSTAHALVTLVSDLAMLCVSTTMANKTTLTSQELWKEFQSMSVFYTLRKMDLWKNGRARLWSQGFLQANSTQALILGSSQGSNKNVRVLTKKISLNSKISHMVEQPLLIGSRVLRGVWASRAGLCSLRARLIQAASKEPYVMNL